MAMSQSSARRIVRGMFRWTFDSPIPYPAKEQQLRLSAIANIVIDSKDGLISNEYHACKRERNLGPDCWSPEAHFKSYRTSDGGWITVFIGAGPTVVP